jgi:hypothetical protein
MPPDIRQTDTVLPHYTRHSVAFSLLLLLLVAAGNGLINPYLVFDAPVIAGINTAITENYFKQLVFKPYQLSYIKPRSLIIGASQAGVGLDPDQLPQPAYNLAIGGSTSYLHYRLLQEALSVDPALQNLILETPFFAFNNSDPNNTPGMDQAFENRLHIDADFQINHQQPLHAWEEKIASLISWDVTRASWRTVNKQKQVAEKSRGSFIQKRNGQWIQQTPLTTPTSTLIENSWRKSIFNDWLPAPSHIYTSGSTTTGPMAYYRQSLRLLYARNTHTTIVIAPMHASLFIALQQTALWPLYQQWKAALVTINSEEAMRAGISPFPVLDFAYINDKTTEPLPGSNNKNSTRRLQWFNDSMHPSPALGERVLQDILSGKTQTGRILQADNVQQLLAADETAVSVYTAANPELASNLSQLIKSHDYKESP